VRTVGLAVLTAGLLLGAEAPRGEDVSARDAEKLFRAMEEKLAKAKALECFFAVELNSVRYKGSLLLGEGGKARLEINEASEAKAIRVRLVSDGTRLSYQDNGMPTPKLEDTPKDLGADMLTWLARPGLFSPQAPLPDVKADDARDRFRVSDFRHDKEEKIGGRVTQRLSYRLAVKGQRDPFSVVVWIDSKTGLPVKRMVSSRIGGEKTTVVETYTKLTLDGKTDAKKFRLPE
jgi:hypothetical protein